MRVESITLRPDGDLVRVLAEVTSPKWSRPRELWIDVAQAFAHAGSVAAADPWLAALLMPAMRQHEDLTLPGPLSGELIRALEQIQAICARCMPSATTVEIQAKGRRTRSAGREGVGLSFSCGIGSWHSLLLDEDHRLVVRQREITHLVDVYGADIGVDNWKVDAARDMIHDTNRIAETHDSPRSRRPQTCVACTAQPGCRGTRPRLERCRPSRSSRVTSDDSSFAAGARIAAVAANADREAGGCHPLLVPLFAAARCDRRSTAGRMNAAAPIAADCYRNLVEMGADRQVIDALRKGIDQNWRVANQHERALGTIRRRIPAEETTAVLDENELRHDLARTLRRVRPFLDRDGFFNSLPADDLAAGDEVQRIQRGGVRKFIVWQHELWALDAYQGLRDLLESECRLLASAPEVKVYAIAEGP